jgi:hypothetical protein
MLFTRRKTRTVLPCIAALLLAGPASAQDERPSHQGLRCFFGTLHAHCALSGDFEPGIGRAQLENLLENNFEGAFNLRNGPLQAWTHAAENAKIDFVALTDHIRVPSGSDPEGDVGMPLRGYDLLREAAARINGDERFRGRFLAIPGMEWNVGRPSNHINILFARRAVPRSIQNGDFVTLRNRYFNNPDFEGGNPLLCVQMNHPRSVRQDYGRAQFAPSAVGARAFVSDFKDVYLGIEHINNHDQGNENQAERNDHRNGNQLEDDYKRYLNLGFRVAPVGDHDNHRPNWGRHTAARTGVWARELTPEGFAEAYRARRVFATEDNELSVLFLSGSEWMGSVVAVPAQGEVRTFTVRIEQMRDTDTGQALNEGPYTVELLGDEDGVGGGEAIPVEVRQGGTAEARSRGASGNDRELHPPGSSGQLLLPPRGGGARPGRGRQRC